MKILIAYYSRTGKTRLVAETIGKELDADVVEIKDLRNRKGISGWMSAGRDAHHKAKTEIEPKEYDLSKYDVVILGTPMWGSPPAPAIRTFIDNCNFTDKKILGIIVMSGLGKKSAIDSMAELIKEKNGKLLDCIAVYTFLRGKNKLVKRAKEIAEKVK